MNKNEKRTYDLPDGSKLETYHDESCTTGDRKVDMKRILWVEVGDEVAQHAHAGAFNLTIDSNEDGSDAIGCVVLTAPGGKVGLYASYNAEGLRQLGGSVMAAAAALEDMEQKHGR
jgi:hypothetical protein